MLLMGYIGWESKISFPDVTGLLTVPQEHGWDTKSSDRNTTHANVQAEGNNDSISWDGLA